MTADPVPFHVSSQDALAWLRSQLIGADAVIGTPFGERRVTYADFIASGRALRWVEETVQAAVLPLYANTHTEDSATGARTTTLAHEASEYVKRQLGADDRCAAVFCGSGSTAAMKRLQEILGLVVPCELREGVLAALPEARRPVVFVGPYEHHSNEVSWRETLAEVVEVPMCAQGGIDTERLEALLQDPRYAGRPKYGSFSAASNVTGLLTDTRALARLLHAHGARAFFDFAASGPYVPIDMRPGEADGYDAVFLSVHKFVGGPGAPGLLVFHKDLYTRSTPTTPGGGTVRYVSSTRHDYVRDVEALEDAGTPAILGKIRTALAFHVKQRLDPEVLTRREHELSRVALSRLRRHPKLHLLGNLDVPRLSVLSFLVRSGERYLHPRLVVRLLNDLFGIQARGGCACAGPYGHALLNIDDATSERYFQCISSDLEGLKPGWTRLNLAPWIENDELEFLLAAIEFIADHGEKFVSVYHLDWHTGAWRHEADVASVSLFDLSPTPTQTGPAPYDRYLREAHALAAKLGPVRERELPPGVPADLVYFAY